MAISVSLISLARTETGFQAAGTVADKAFTSSTIKWAGDLIFKITEPDENGKLVLKTLAESEFSRGEKIAVARFLKTERVKFESSELLSVDELNKLTAKELRTLAKSRGITGYSAKGVTKADIVAMLAPAADTTPVEVDAAPEVEVEAAAEVEVDVTPAEVEIELSPVAPTAGVEAPPAK